MRIAASLGSLAFVLALGACGDKPQTLEAGKKKPDARAFEGAGDAYAAAGWKNGDQASWEQQIKARNQAQNEYARTTKP